MLAFQPDESSSEELVLELAFDLMIKHGLTDSNAGKTITNEEMLLRNNQLQR